MSRAVAIIMALMVCGVTTAATINVPADYTTIQAAVDAASNGDEILVAPGTYTDTQDGHVVDMKAKAITLRSTDGAAVTIIDGQNARRGIDCYQGETNATVIDGFTITNGFGVGYDYNGDGDINWLEYGGGGIRCYHSSPTITDCTISDNTAGGTYSYGGGIYCSSSSPTITDCTISGNTANSGGGIYCSSSSPTITDCTISGNTANSGGGIYCVYSSSPTITDCTISGNTANDDGGGIYCSGGSPTITGCTISDNTTNDDGGGIYCSGGSPTITGCTISDNTANDDGGGIYCSEGSPTITGCTISDNTTNDDGGGIYCSGGSPTITGCTISDNTAGGTYSYGGGIYCSSSSPTITDCTISGNTANSGGGIFGSFASITGCTISGNTANYGGGVYCSSSNPTITGCTISGNTADRGGGIYSSSSSPTLIDTVVCENAPDNIRGSWTDGGGVCLAYSCQDSDGNGVPDKCDGSIGDGIHEVPSEYATVQEAINAAGYGDTVLVAPGTYTGTGDWVINPGGKPITIRATGTPEETILDGEGARGVVQCTNNEGAGTIIEGFTITGGSANSGGGIYCVYSSSPTITDCTISGNTANSGGGIYCVYSSSPTITDCTISGNTANDDGGGIYSHTSDPTITNCTISGNTASGTYALGGGIYCSSSSPTITGCTISNNAADFGGGIYCAWDDYPRITGCTISNNTANVAGGGVYRYNYTSTPTLTDTVLCENAPDNISGAWTDGGGMCLATYCTDSDDDGIVDECDDQVGDGIHEVPGEFEHIADAVTVANDGDTVLVAPGTYTGTGDWVINPLGKPITIRASGTAEETILDGQGLRRVVDCSSGETEATVIEGFTITGGYAAGQGNFQHGGGIYCYASSPTITDCTILNNTAEGDGGGMYCWGNSNPTITDCTISNNTAAADGGGMSCYGSNLTLSNCTISNNIASDDGGGIACNSNSAPDLSDCLISNNTAGDDGGGIYHEGGANSILRDTTVCGNMPYQIYGFYSDEGGNTISTTCEAGCDEDVAGNDQVVDGADLDVILSLWNQDVDAIDISGDGIIGITDLLMLLEAWGPCP